MYVLMIVIFILGYCMIALEHPLKIDKAAPALLIAVLGWVAYMLGADAILRDSLPFQQYLTDNPDGSTTSYIVGELSHSLAHHSEIIFFLMGAMTIVELVDAHQGFNVITDKITTKNRVVLLWTLSIITFFLSATLDNLTTSIVMISLLRKLVYEQKERWFFAGIIIIAANSGGAWSPIGDITTTMLWIGGQITATNIIAELIVPSLICMVVPLILLSFTMKGDVVSPPKMEEPEHIQNKTTSLERNVVFFTGVAGLVFVPIFKTVTHLPPYMGMMFSLGVLWIVTELLHRSKNHEEKSHLSVIGVLRKIDMVSILFFLGILLAISSLQSAGHLSELAVYFKENLGNIYAINIAIGLLSAIVDNVPLVAASMGMYDIETAQTIAFADPANRDFIQHFIQDGNFWEFLAYCAGTGGSVLIIGSASGVAIMGMERIDFGWYIKKISLLALLGYLAGAVYFILRYS